MATNLLLEWRPWCTSPLSVARTGSLAAWSWTSCRRRRPLDPRFRSSSAMLTCSTPMSSVFGVSFLYLVCDVVVWWVVGWGNINSVIWCWSRTAEQPTTTTAAAAYTSSGQSQSVEFQCNCSAPRVRLWWKCTRYSTPGISDVGER